MRLAAALFCFVALAQTPVVRFVDIATEAGLTLPTTYGGKENLIRLRFKPSPK